MPSLKAIRTRIASVKNTQKITRAMKLVAAARLRRAQDQIIAARPYARTLEEVIAEVAARAGTDAHPLLEVREQKKVELIVVSSDRGLAGAYNTNVNRATERFLYEHKHDIAQIGVSTIGRKAKEYLKRRKVEVGEEFAGVTTPIADERARELARRVVKMYVERRVDAVYVIYNEFKSAISQRVQVERLLPVAPKKLPQGFAPTDYLWEPNKQVVLDQLLPMYVQVELYRAFLEAIASEFGARMSAMDNATNNATDMIGKLTLQYNRARQAAITKELLEIIGGAEALKG